MVGTPAAVTGAAKEGPDAAPRFLPLLVVLSVLLWFYTTTGGRQVFVKEVLGGAYDSQAEHFLQSNVDVDAAAIGHEAMIVDGKVRMYFGPFPAFLRIPLNFVYPTGHGKWSRVSGFCLEIFLSTMKRLSGACPGRLPHCTSLFARDRSRPMP